MSKPMRLFWLRDRVKLTDSRGRYKCSAKQMGSRPHTARGNQRYLYDMSTAPVLVVEDDLGYFTVGFGSAKVRPKYRVKCTHCDKLYTIVDGHDGLTLHQA